MTMADNVLCMIKKDIKKHKQGIYIIKSKTKKSGQLQQVKKIVVESIRGLFAALWVPIAIICQVKANTFQYDQVGLRERNIY